MDGFNLRPQRGSHRRYRHQDGRRVTVSFHTPAIRSQRRPCRA
ncbi:MAG: type II toxin-antitoxin system HicA family toxin [Chloroflexi bacterium]|nr:type II toxin-antitoxin system HicA family toxin [Chloroflexota bacterium]